MYYNYIHEQHFKYMETFMFYKASYSRLTTNNKVWDKIPIYHEHYTFDVSIDHSLLGTGPLSYVWTHRPNYHVNLDLKLMRSSHTSYDVNHEKKQSR